VHGASAACFRGRAPAVVPAVVARGFDHVYTRLLEAPLRPALALVPAAIPVVALVGGLPFANRLEPVLFGMPFLLTWILAWLALTPVFLWIAYVVHRRAGGDGTGDGR